MNPSYGIIMWIVVGAVAGFIASKLVGPREGLLADIIVGVLGGVVGGFIASHLLGDDPSNNGFVMSTLIATGGAALVLVIKKLITRRTALVGR